MEEIGEYLQRKKSCGHELFEDAIKLNCARNGLRYIIRAYKIKEIFIPYYTCPVVWQAVRSENCKIKFYHVDKNFMPVETFDKNAYVLYANYFGVCGRNVVLLSQKYPNLIVDNAHAFYSPKMGLASFNSPRKFVGVPDGCYLFCDKRLEENFEQDLSTKRFENLQKKLEREEKEGYFEASFDDKSLNGQPIKIMSGLTREFLSSVGYGQVASRRMANFRLLHNALKSTNELDLELAEFDVPMVYPYFVSDDTLRPRLIKNKIFVSSYWSALGAKLYESKLQKYLIPLPIDQRYDENDMEIIIKMVLNR